MRDCRAKDGRSGTRAERAPLGVPARRRLCGVRVTSGNHWQLVRRSPRPKSRSGRRGSSTFSIPGTNGWPPLPELARTCDIVLGILEDGPRRPQGSGARTELVAHAGDRIEVVMLPKVEGVHDSHYADRLLAQLEAR